MIPRRALGIVIIAWALVSWGGRIGLLTGPESADLVTWLRIGGSLVTAAIAAAALIFDAPWIRPATWLYAGTVAAIWSTSLASVWADGSNSAGFRLVHTVLAAISLSLAVLAIRAAGQATGTGGAGAGGTAATS